MNEPIAAASTPRGRWRSAWPWQQVGPSAGKGAGAFFEVLDPRFLLGGTAE
ncbi:hypothetical protein [Streptomyces sp. TS71-3]|uniref:hypothetical protein n=1 Tax=Streptomyces sp. TS71-3 TaxID=2733862 RepID=UPI001BB44F15|nr:hypothetical protein [Streptomyces sp. TS71-3]